MAIRVGKQNTAGKVGKIGRMFRVLRRGVRSFGHRWLSLLVVSSISFALWGVLTSPEFHVSIVSIRRITPPTLAGDDSLVKIQSFTGLVGQPIFLLDPNQVTREIARLPAVADARLFLVLPGQAIVEMAERQPEARWIANGHVFLISREGEILGSDDAPDLPVTIIDETGVPIRSGDRVDASAVQMAFHLAGSIDAFRHWHQCVSLFSAGRSICQGGGWMGSQVRQRRPYSRKNPRVADCPQGCARETALAGCHRSATQQESDISHIADAIR